MAKYNLYIRAVPGYPRYYATVEGDILKKRGNSFLSLHLLKFTTVIIRSRLSIELKCLD